VFYSLELTNERSFWDRGILQTMHHGDWQMAMTTWPVRFDGAVAPVKPAPLLGEHTAEALGDWLSLGSDEVETLRRDPRASYATITTFEPLTDVSYIPCVSLLDFWLRSGRLELVVYAHSIDFGKKGFGNLVQLAELQRHVAEQLDAPVGPLVMIIKSATIYLTEVASMRDALAAAGRLDRSEDY